MRFFTHEWAGLDDADAQKAIAEHWKTLLKIDVGTSVDLVQFTKDFDLRGALLDKLSVNEGNRAVCMRLIGGDNQTGYFAISIRYEDAMVEGSPDDVRRAFESRKSRVRFDEFDVSSDGRPCHRFLLWPKEFGEFSISFSDFTFETLKLRQRGYLNFGEVYEENSELD